MNAQKPLNRTDIRHEVLRFIADNPYRITRHDSEGGGKSGFSGHLAVYRPGWAQALHVLYQRKLVKTNSINQYRPGQGQITLTLAGQTLLAEWDEKLAGEQQ